MADREGVTPGDPERAAALDLVHRLREVVLRLDQAVSEFARSTGLHTTDVRALIALLDAERGGVEATPSWLAGQLGMTSQATTAVLHRLENAGNVERLRSPSDARSTHLRVSAAAVDLGWDFFGPLLDQLVDATRALRPEERATVVQYLDAVAAAITQLNR